MSKINKILLIAFGVVVLFFISNLTQNKPKLSTIQDNSAKTKPILSQKDKLSPQDNEGGNVTVTAEPEVLKIGQTPKFKLEFNTHSEELSFDVAKQSYVLDDMGNKLDGATWNGSPPGGHHRNGTLTFSGSLSQTKYIEFIITDIAGVEERKFKWEL